MRLEEPICEHWKKKYQDQVDINLGDAIISPLTLHELENLSHTHINEENVCLNYAYKNDELVLKEELAKLYNVSVDQICLTPGTKAANSSVMQSLLEKDDEVVCIMPAFQQLVSFPFYLDAKVKYYMVIEYENWKINFEELEKLFTPYTKLVLINYPNNPLGLSLTKEDMNQLIDLCERYGSYLLNDESYYGLGDMTSFAGTFENAIITSGLSRNLSLPGIRIGWAIAKPALIERMEILKHYSYLSIGKLDIKIALLALQHRNAIIQRNIEILNKNIEELKKWLENEPEITCTIPQGGAVAFLKYRILDVTSKEASLELIEQYKLLTIPGIAFGVDEYLRINLGVDDEIFKEGLRRLSMWRNSKKK